MLWVYSRVVSNLHPLVSIALYSYENYAHNRISNVDFKNLDDFLEKLISKRLQCFNFIFALSITEGLELIINFMSVLTKPN